jgi:hypothetical protein
LLRFWIEMLRCRTAQPGRQSESNQNPALRSSKK